MSNGAHAIGVLQVIEKAIVGKIGIGIKAAGSVWQVVGIAT